MATLTKPPRAPVQFDWAAWVLIVAVLLLLVTLGALLVR